MSAEGPTRRQVLAWMAAMPAVAVGTRHRPWHKPKPPPLSPGALNAIPGYGQSGGFWLGGPL